MSDTVPSPPPDDAEFARLSELDALAAILPWEARDRLAAILTDDDVATLKHLAAAGMGDNTLRALASDLSYLEAWALAATSAALPWPAPAPVRTDATLDLTEPPRSVDRMVWTHLTAYAPCHDLSDAARQAEAALIRYESVRDPQHGANLAVLSPAAFAGREPERIRDVADESGRSGRKCAGVPGGALRV